MELRGNPKGESRWRNGDWGSAEGCSGGVKELDTFPGAAVWGGIPSTVLQTGHALHARGNGTASEVRGRSCRASGGGGTNVRKGYPVGVEDERMPWKPEDKHKAVVPRYMFVREGRLETAVTSVAETVAAVNRPIAAGAERYHGIHATLGADDGVHFPGGTLVPTRALFGAASRAAGLTPLGIVDKSAGGKELLLSHREDKLCPAVHAYQSSIG